MVITPLNCSSSSACITIASEPRHSLPGLQPPCHSTPQSGHQSGLGNIFKFSIEEFLVLLVQYNTIQHLVSNVEQYNIKTIFCTDTHHLLSRFELKLLSSHLPSKYKYFTEGSFSQPKIIGSLPQIVRNSKNAKFGEEIILSRSHNGNCALLKL